MNWNALFWRYCLHNIFSTFNNFDLIRDKLLSWRFIGPCKLCEGLPGEASHRSFCVRFSDALTISYFLFLFASAHSVNQGGASLQPKHVSENQNLIVELFPRSAEMRQHYCCPELPESPRLRPALINLHFISLILPLSMKSSVLCLTLSTSDCCPMHTPLSAMCPVVLFKSSCHCSCALRLLSYCLSPVKKARGRCAVSGTAANR